MFRPYENLGIMKTYIRILLAMGLSAFTSFAVEPDVSASVIEPVAAEPAATQPAAQFEFLYYPRGRVKHVDGVVVESDIIIQEAYQQQLVKQAILMELRRQKMEEAKRKLFAAGTKRKQELLEIKPTGLPLPLDPVFPYTIPRDR